MESFDIAIVGGGLVGASLACALEPSGLRVLLLEAGPSRTAATSADRSGSPLDERSFALARRSVESLSAIGVFARAAGEAQPIRRVHVTSRGDFGAVRIDARDYGLDALGHTVPARVLGAALEARLSELPTLARWFSARVVAIGIDAHQADSPAHLTIEREGGRVSVAARLVVGADGTESFVREALGLRVIRRDYAQTAIVTTIEPARPHDQVAYERFGASGPFALLPLADQRCGLVWTMPSADVDAVLALDDAAFLAAAQAQFGSRLGRFRRVGKRQPWKLARVEAERLVGPRAVLVGNAAQTIHPIGAQGFNLGLRDVMALVDAIAARDPAARTASGDAEDARRAALGSIDQLERYERARLDDRRDTADGSERLLRLFEPQGELARLLRGAGLAVLDRLPPLKRELAYTMMGYRPEARA